MLKDHVTGYQHIGIPTNDIAKTKEFFMSMGFEPVFETVNNGEQVCFLSMGPIVIETYQNGRAAMARGAVDHIALDTNDLPSCVRLVRENEYQVVEGPAFLPFFEHGVAYISIIGPDLEVVEFNQRFRSEEEKGEVLKAVGIC